MTVSCLQSSRQGLRKPTPGLRRYVPSANGPPIVQISNGTFYRHHPASITRGISNPPLFRNLNFNLPSFSTKPNYWAILGPSSSGKTSFLQIIRGMHLCFPPGARTYPYLSSEEVLNRSPEFRLPSKAIQYVGFGSEQGGLSGQSSTRGAYLSARYESRREDTDFSVLNYLQGKTELNPIEELDGRFTDKASLEKVVSDLRLADLIDMPISNLSNGQTRRAKIARALLGKPELLLLDEPFMGLDPPTLMTLSPLLQKLAEANTPRLILTLRPQDPIPDWITHLIYLKTDCQVAYSGSKSDVLGSLREHAESIRKGKREPEAHIPVSSLHEIGRELTANGIVESGGVKKSDISTFVKSAEVENSGESVSPANLGQPLVEMAGVRVAYGDKVVLGNWEQTVEEQSRKGLWWNIMPGQRWGIFGANGSGKTTVLSLICSDHPQTYSLPIRLFGRSRLPERGEPGISIFDIQAKIGHSSPEIHHHIPRTLTIRQTLENAWSETFKSKAQLDHGAPAIIESCLRWFESELRPGGASTAEKGNAVNSTTWADEYIFGELSFSAQRVALFLRAVIKNPPLVILDEAFSGMDDAVRDKCMLFLAHGENQTFAPESALSSQAGRRQSVPSDVAKAGRVLIHGLGPDQALLCISHVREEVPDCIREWICLPEANTGERARFGRLQGPLEEDYRRWNEIWGM